MRTVCLVLSLFAVASAQSVTPAGRRCTNLSDALHSAAGLHGDNFCSAVITDDNGKVYVITGWMWKNAPMTSDGLLDADAAVVVIRKSYPSCIFRDKTMKADWEWLMKYKKDSR